MSNGNSQKLNTCGCCQPGAAPTPVCVRNRPGLTAVAYRVGTFSSFREAMIRAITQPVLVEGTPLRPLLDFTARTSDDYGIALLEMWAYIADILTFYQERIVNEAFLRTARQAESLRTLAAMLDYIPAPGAAASAYLAFTLEKEKQLKLPVELKVQSVPGPGEKPQKFETVEAIQTHARFNEVRVFPLLQSRTATQLGSTWGFLQPPAAAQASPPLAPGSKLVAGQGTQPVEEKEVTAVESKDGFTILRWAPAVGLTGLSVRLYPWIRRFKLFGHNAPATYLKPTFVTATNSVTWAQVNTDFDLGAAPPSLNLDGVYENLKVGGLILIVVEGVGIFPARLSQVGSGNARIADNASGLPLMQATVTGISFTQPDGTALSISIADLRKVMVYELAGPDLSFWNFEYPLAISGNTAYARIEQLAEIEKGRTVLLLDGVQAPHVAKVSATCVGAPNDHLCIEFLPGLPAPLATASAVLLGNVALATHGETVAGEVLGSGDAAAAFQTFTAAKAPVTYVAKAGAPRGVAHTLEVRVDGVLWKERRDFFGLSTDERAFTTRVNAAGKTLVRFGDGVTGARLDTGRNNLTAKYRHGLGVAGNVGRAALTTLLTRPTGLKSVRNPAAAAGGANPEPQGLTRRNAPNTVRTFGRVVSLRDFEDATREVPGIVKARATWAWNGEQQVVHLTVAGEGGAAVPPDRMQALVADLDTRRDPNKLLLVENYRPLDVTLEAVIRAHADYIADDVLAAARAALLALLAFENRDLGQPVHLSDMFHAMQCVPGVVYVDINRLDYKHPADGASHAQEPGPIRPHVRVFPAIAVLTATGFVVSPAELARYQAPETDAIVLLGS